MSKILVLDAMGVLYKAGDDVAELLVPFVVAKHGTDSVQEIEDAYLHASCGQMTSRDFWLGVGVDPQLEDEYLEGHCLSDGLLEFLAEAQQAYGRVVCLSNDVSEWSVKLRKRFGLEEYISGWFISGDLHIRKPAPAIYQKLISALNVHPSDMVFVDDLPKNLLPAQTLGMSCVLFDSEGNEMHGQFPVARTLRQIIHP